jgi:hypothetical protein
MGSLRIATLLSSPDIIKRLIRKRLRSETTAKDGKLQLRNGAPAALRFAQICAESARLLRAWVEPAHRRLGNGAGVSCAASGPNVSPGGLTDFFCRANRLGNGGCLFCLLDAAFRHVYG